MSLHSKVAVAVAAALTSSVALAAPGTWTPLAPGSFSGTTGLTLNIAGSSAARDMIILNMDQQLCDRNVGGNWTSQTAPTGGTDSLAFYKVTGDGDLRIFTCTLKGGADGSLLPSVITNTTNIAGKNLLVYYRSDGGSVWGLIGALRGTQIIRADFTTSAGALNPGVPTVTNDASAYTYGAVTGSVALDTVLLGVQDVDVNNYTSSTNWPTTIKVAGAALNSTEVTNETNGDFVTVGQIFGIMVNKSPGFTSTTSPPIADQSISYADLAGIFTHTYTDWSQVPSLKGSGVTGALTICRRDIGSGSHVTVATHILNTGCGRGSQTFTSTLSSASGTTPLFNSSTGKEQTCVNGNNGTIGYSSYDDTASFQTANPNI